MNEKIKSQGYIVSVNSRYAYNTVEIPGSLVSVISVTGLYEWEQSPTPIDHFGPIAGATGATYSFSAPLTQTTYFRRKITTATNVAYSNIIKLELVSATWEKFNYVREHDVLIPGVSDWQTIDQMEIGSKLQTTTYMDGLGRPAEKVSREAGTPANPDDSWNDIVQFHKYDNEGREREKYLTYTTETNYGRFANTPRNELDAYYTTIYNETSAFASATFDNSPLNQVFNLKKPGTSWAAGAGISSAYEMNGVADNVQIFTVGYNSGDAPVSLGAYSANTLYKNRTTDENGKQVIEYTNKAGQLILKKVQVDDSYSADYAGWICTYSVYDDFGSLRYHIQPEAVLWLMANNWSFSGSNGQKILNEMCLRYEYDDKGRTTLKKAPGSEPLFMLYDERDRVVFMQDGNQRKRLPAEWTANLYDDLDRPVITTLYHTAKTINQLQSDINDAHSIQTVTINNPSGLVADLTVDHRDVSIHAYVAQNSIEFDPGFESSVNDEFTASIDPTAVITPIVVTTATYHNPISETDLNNTAVNTIVKYMFYDYYNYSTVKAFNTNFDNLQAYTTGEPIAKTQRTWSMATGSMTRVLGANTFLTNTLYYDEKGRTIQTTEDNIKTGTDVTTFQYQFDNRLLSSNTKHTTTGSGYTNFSTVTKNIFDRIGRITSIEKKYGANNFKAVAAYTYDDMGKLKLKRLDPGYTGTGKNEIETLVYSYNIHSEITGINKDYALKTSGLYNKWDNFFGLYLGYDNRDAVFDNSQLDGHVTGTLWNTQGDDAQRKFDFAYDNAGRLVNALFKEQATASGSWSNASMNFSVTGYTGKIQYDLNGNLLSMLQKGVLPGNPTPLTVDDLRYSYASLSNKLNKVADVGTLGVNNGKLGDFKDGSNPADDYVYDDNGNLVVDLNKNAVNSTNGSTTALGNTGILYNYLDKPEEIHIAGKGTIKLVYDADGNKLQKLYTPEGTSTTTTTTYINEFVYVGNDLQYINFEEGRIRVMQAVSENNGFDLLNIDGNIDLPNTKRGAFDFFIRDYQSNVRMILTEESHSGSNICTMETSRAPNEEPVFGQVDAGGNPTAANEVAARFPVANIPGQSTGSGWDNPAINSYVSRIGASAGSKIGPNTLLKVMAGDELTATTQYFYQNLVTNTGSGNTVLTNIITALVNAISGSSVTNNIIKGSATSIGNNLNGSLPFSSATAPDAGNATGSNPKAYLTMLFFDERFNFVQEGSASVRVHDNAAGNSSQNLDLPNIKAPKNGYVYIYVSNESNEHVYFDNLQINHSHGRIIEENHYYPYGLTIAAISSRKLGDVNEGMLKNSNLYNDKELFDDADLNWYDYGFRNYDPQIGRFPQLDPLSFYYPELTPFQYASCEPIANVDMDGLESSLATTGIQTAGGVWTGGMLLEKAATTTLSSDLVKAIVHTASMSNSTAQAISMMPQVHSEESMIKRTMDAELLNMQQRLSQPTPTTPSFSSWCKECETLDEQDQNRKKQQRWYLDHGMDEMGNKSWTTKLIENKHFDRFASHIAIPLMEMYGGEALLNLGRKILIKYVFETAAKETLTQTQNAFNLSKEWLGEDAIVKTNKSGDNIFISKDGLRKLRFDINNSQGDIPHLHLETFKNGKWRDAVPGTHRLYVK